MSLGRIPAALRRQVRKRAGNRCEYCLLAEEHAFFPHEADHIIAEKHRGETTIENLALACFDCNRYKGSDIASIDIATGELVPLFNPRAQNWNDHFAVDVGKIIPLTPVGRVTEFLLKLNNPERIEVREMLAGTNRFP